MNGKANGVPYKTHLERRLDELIALWRPAWLAAIDAMLPAEAKEKQ